MSLLRLSKSSRYSPIRLMSSLACMRWNSSTSGPSGVVISMTLAMVLSRPSAGADRRAGIGRLRRAYDKTGNGHAGLEAQLAAPDVRMQPCPEEDALHLLRAMGIAPIRLEHK